MVTIPRRRFLLRTGALFFGAIFLCKFYNILESLILKKLLASRISSGNGSEDPRHHYAHNELFDKLNLTENECRATFPDLTKEIDDAVARGPFNLTKAPDGHTGLVQGQIKDGKLYVISAERDPSRQMKWERDSVLHQIHRALITSPTPLPNTIFTLTILDSPRANAWSFSRSNDPLLPSSYWIMPHFSFWSWPLPFIGTIDQALLKIDKVEQEWGWKKKLDKVVWRGTGWFNSAGNTQLRPLLLKKTEGKDWADVEVLRWENSGEKSPNALGIEEFCKYKYIIYTEGITYSGRLLFHQACESIILTPPLSYLMHTTHLMRPLFSSTLPFSPTKHIPPSKPRWPTAYPPSEANVIFVDPEWSDLEETIMWLRKNEEVAKGIASRQRRLVAEEGYLSQAAEVCYWRSLIRGWASVVMTEGDERWKKGKDGQGSGDGIRFETFSLTEKTGWE